MTRPSSTATFAGWISPLKTLTSFAFLNSNSAGCSPRAMASFCWTFRIILLPRQFNSCGLRRKQNKSGARNPLQCFFSELVERGDAEFKMFFLRVLDFVVTDTVQ